ncbi:NAD(P)H-dependent oxidoreductase [Sphingomonas sp. MMS24-J13]|uniref:NAD(P)H-dependent oxidoreductase n=1 Tax=Sphingomonas sp. MMS24-J13 TaxID=3238686 RepID=UPI00384CB5A6
MTEVKTKPPIARHAVILCHPAPGSFNHTVAQTYVDTVRECGQDAIVRDLYALGFDPTLKASERPTQDDFVLSPDVAAEIEAIRDCDVFVLVYPIWYGTPPAMLKGYVERVFGSGINPKTVQTRSAEGFLAGKRLISFTSSGASDAWLNEQGELLSLRSLFDRYLVHAFAMRGEQHVHFSRIVSGMAERFVNENLFAVRDRARHVCSELLMEQHHKATAAIRQNETI